jgi:trehalose utilization protein
MIRKIATGPALAFYLACCLAICLAAPAGAQNGPVTSNLKKVLVYYFNYGASDHQNTPTWAAYFQTLGAAHGYTADVTASQSVFTAANLANYQAIVLFSAYNFGTNMSTAQKSAVENWYKTNHGIACFHQCVKNLWGGDYPNWYDSLMGTQYQTWAGFGSGPVYVNAAVEGTDLAMGIASNGATTQYKADYTLSWDDEWYTYSTVPGANVLGGKTRMMWTTKRGDHTFGTNFVAPGELQPIAWAREVGGGRFTLNSVFHRDGTRTSPNAAMRQFIDGALVGTLRYLAGYTGCTDRNFLEYNPKATHAGSGACVTPVTSGIRIQGDGSSTEAGLRALKVSVTGPGAHTVEVFGPNGKKAMAYRGNGPHDYSFEGLKSTGIHFIRVKAGARIVTKRIFLYQ